MLVTDAEPTGPPANADDFAHERRRRRGRGAPVAAETTTTANGGGAGRTGWAVGAAVTLAAAGVVIAGTRVRPAPAG
jgi:uncharacterized protein HemX